MSFTSSEVRLYREVLEQAQTQSMLALAATNASIERRQQNFRRGGYTRFSIVEQEIDELVAEQESATLFAINATLEVLHNRPENYGICEECGRGISIERLQLFPWSSRCSQHSDEQIQ